MVGYEWISHDMHADSLSRQKYKQASTDIRNESEKQDGLKVTNLRPH